MIFKNPFFPDPEPKIYWECQLSDLDWVITPPIEDESFAFSFKGSNNAGYLCFVCEIPFRKRPYWHALIAKDPANIHSQDIKTELKPFGDAARQVRARIREMADEMEAHGLFSMKKWGKVDSPYEFIGDIKFFVEDNYEDAHVLNITMSRKHRGNGLEKRFFDYISEWTPYQVIANNLNITDGNYDWVMVRDSDYDELDALIAAFVLE